ncbi:class I SAM-dependent methyltransferase [SAR86 cluster bacterium]|nr:class I SAM-dependent methyltransferase [SAR86 cluster bacterium]
MTKEPVVDSHIKKLLKKIDNENIDWTNEKQNLISMIENGGLIERKWQLKLIEDHSKKNNTTKILDYGCGTGILNLLLLLKGYNDVHGVDVVKKFDDRILKHMNFNSASFNLINAKDTNPTATNLNNDDEQLPFDDNTFDIITSSLVLEHVVNPDFYYSEAARLLKPGGVCFFNFPHRLKPYDTHSRCWFIHYFPKNIRKVLWDIFSRQGGDYLNNYLYLRTVSTHKKIAKKYFSYAEDRTGDRIKNTNLVNYKGNSKLRLFASKLMDLKYIGNIFVKIFSLNASVDLYLVK